MYSKLIYRENIDIGFVILGNVQKNASAFINTNNRS